MPINNELQEISKKINKIVDASDKQVSLAFMKRYKECGEHLLEARRIIQAQKDEWSKLNHYQQKRVENRDKQPISFIDYTKNYLPFNKNLALYYMDIARYWEECKLYECDNLTSAMNRIGRKYFKENAIGSQIGKTKKGKTKKYIIQTITYWLEHASISNKAKEHLILALKEIEQDN